MAGPHRSTPAAGSSRQSAYKVQPPRPPNAWILYRSFKFATIKQSNERVSQATVSKRISDMWKNEADHVKRHFERMAEDKKAEHQQLYPDYRFAPQRREEKARAKEDRKLKSKKSKAHEATPVGADVGADVDATPMIPASLPIPYMPPSCFIPGYQPNMVLQHPYMIHCLPEIHYGPAGPSPPISAAPSPEPYESSESSEAQPHAEENVASSSSSLSSRPSLSSESQASSSSVQLPANPLHLSSLPSSHQPSPNAYATQTHPSLPFQTPAPAELPLTSPQAQLPPPENTVAPVAPVWNNIPAQLSSLDSQNSEVVNFDIPIDQTQNPAEFKQDLSGSSSIKSLQGMVSGNDENNIFDLSNIDSLDLLAQPQGGLDVAMGPQASTVDYNEELFTDFDFAEFQRQMTSLADSGSSSAPVAPPSIEEDLQALFQIPDDPEVQGYTTAQQRQSSIFMQDMMNFFNFDAAEGSTEDTSTVSPAPAPTTVAPQQVRPQSTQHAAAMPIFTQMTNTPTVASGTSYVPPAGAIYSSTRRVAGSWKPSFSSPLSQMEESWTLSSN